jgi:3-methyladenine DNA glycosylase AlkD
MTTIKQILSENRNSVISSIKFVFNVWKKEDVKVKMFELLVFAEKNYSSESSIESFLKSKKVKTLLKYMVQKLAISQKTKTDSRKWYEISEDIADSKGLYRNSLTGNYTK